MPSIGLPTSMRPSDCAIPFDRSYWKRWTGSGILFCCCWRGRLEL